MTESTDLTKLGEFGSMITAERPTGKDEGQLGTEGITRDDIMIPRVGLAQKMSPEIDATSPKYIENLKFMDLFNSLSKQIYGTGPLHFVILRRDDPRWIEFNPLEEGGGIKDRDVPSDDPRTEFGPNGEKPVATMFYDFIVLLLTGLSAGDPLQNVMALSLKGSGIKAAKQLNMLVQQRGPKKICKGVYEVRTSHDLDKKSGGVYAIYKFKNAGWLKPDSPLEKMAIEMFEAWKDREVEIDRGADDADEFDPAKFEGDAATAANM
jgi:hypothetical protein